ncbi:hypothetical protein R1flu_005427 [Riccia fluitans]|uniref:Uncharacterized protein n=1 Tax=Riccia fluitans TaxID=41844 RepID=A0ABD1YT50_9MARC
MDEPQSRKKMKMPEKDTIELSDDEPQEAKREEETVLTEGTSQVLETNMIENFRKSMVYGEQVVVPILRFLEETKPKLKRKLEDECLWWRSCHTSTREMECRKAEAMNGGSEGNLGQITGQR